MSAAAQIDNLSPAKEVLVARQPIYNSQLGVFAYELLFRSRDKKLHEIGEDNATAHVVMNTFLTMGLENLVGGRLAAINISEWYLYKAEALPVPQDKIILDIPSGLSVSKEAVLTIKKLKSLGFQVAIENFHYRKALLPLLGVVDILKIDTHGVDKDILPQYIKQLRKFKNLKLLSLKVESLSEFSFYRDIGFDYCQGYLLSKPRVYTAKNLASSKLVIMNLLSVLYKTKFDFNELEKIISRDVSISYKLLKLINSAFFGLPNQIDSLQSALVLLGRDQLRSWISMLALSDMDDCPESLLEIAVIRAKMCELLARQARLAPLDAYFTVGLFSALDVLMKQPLQTLLTSLPLSDEIKSALLHQQGLMGQALKCVLAYERSDWENTGFMNLPAEIISKTGFQSFVWASGLLRTL